MSELDRRTFIHVGIAAGGLAAGYGCQPGPSTPASGYTADTTPLPGDAATPFELAEMTIGELQEAAAAMTAGAAVFAATRTRLTGCLADRVPALAYPRFRADRRGGQV